MRRTGKATHPEHGERECVEWDDGGVYIRSVASIEGVGRWAIEWDEPVCDRPHADDIDRLAREIGDDEYVVTMKCYPDGSVLTWRGSYRHPVGGPSIHEALAALRDHLAAPAPLEVGTRLRHTDGVWEVRGVVEDRVALRHAGGEWRLLLRSLVEGWERVTGDYHIKGDGVTDNAARMQAMANNTGSVWLDDEPGRFRMSREVRWPRGESWRVTGDE